MKTETTSRKQSTMGKAAYTAAAAKGFEPFKIGSMFEFDGVLYRITNNAVGGLQSYFSHERVPSISFYLSDNARASLSGLSAAVEEALGRIRAMAPEPSAPFGFPLDGNPVCMGCPECDLLNDLEEPKSVGPYAELEAAKARITELESVADALRGLLTDTRKVLASRGYVGDATSVPELVDRAIDAECRRAEKAEAHAKSNAALADRINKRAEDFEGRLFKIHETLKGAEIIPF